MVYGIATRAGGSASISTVGGAGTTITVLFPLSDSDSLPVDRPLAHDRRESITVAR
jgi:hypothetical protein